MLTNESKIGLIELYPNPNAITAGDGLRLVDGLEAVFPQDEIARLGLATDIGNITLIACRQPLEEDSELVGELSPKEYELLILLAHGLS